MSDGIPSPNPQFPQSIKNVTGNANVKIQNKNLFDKNNFEYVNGKRFDDNGNVISDANSSYSLTLISVKPNTTYTIQGTQSENTKTTRIYYYNNQKQFISRTGPFGTDSYSFTTLENCNYIGLQLRNSEYINVNIIQLEQGTTATSYVPHQEQNLPVTLGNIELCKIVNYQDYFYKENGKWYLHKEILKKVYNGTENWELNGIYNCPSIRFGEVLNKKAENSLSNYFIEKSAQLLATEYGMYTKYSGILFVGFPNATITEFKTWLSIHNLILYIGTDTPINTEITDTTLIEQLEATLQATSYDDIIYITSESDELGFNMNVVAVADANKVIDSLDTRLLALESEV